MDAGKTWNHVWKQEGQIGTMVVHPKNPDIAFAAVLGHAFGPNPERGVYRTKDGGKTWQQVLKKDNDTGASDVAIRSHQIQILCLQDYGKRADTLGINQWRSWKWTCMFRAMAEILGNNFTGNGLPDGIWGKSWCSSCTI